MTLTRSSALATVKGLNFMRCPECNTENMESAKFCNECGHSFAPPSREALLSSLPSVDSLSEEFDFSDVDTSQTADLSGLEKLVDSSYVPPRQSGRLGNTMELPAVSDEATQGKSFIADSPSSEDITSKQPELTPEEREKRASKRRIALVCTLLAVLLAACGAWFTYSMEFWGGKDIPDVVGESEANAQFVLEQKGFTTRTMLVKSDEVAGIVLLTDPASGRRAPEGSEVIMHISTPRVIPEVVGLAEDEAKALISAEGFTKVEYTYVKSNDEEGRVLSIKPDPGTEQKSGVAIVVEITQAYTVPETTGMSKDEAKGVLEAEGYSVSIQWHYDENAVENTAYVTDPVAGTKLNSGSEVTLYVNMKRSTVLVSETKAYLNSQSTFSIGGTNYEIKSVDSVSYLGDNLTQYTITARPFETYYWFGSIADTRYGEYGSVTGIISWNDSNQISGSDPSIKKL